MNNDNRDDWISTDEKIKAALLAFGNAQNARIEAEDRLRGITEHEQHLGIVVTNLLLEKKNNGC